MQFGECRKKCSDLIFRFKSFPFRSAFANNTFAVQCTFIFTLGGENDNHSYSKPSIKIDSASCTINADAALCSWVLKSVSGWDKSSALLFALWIRTVNRQRVGSVLERIDHLYMRDKWLHECINGMKRINKVNCNYMGISGYLVV